MAAPARWRAVLTDRAYKPITELHQATQLQYSRSLSKLATCAFRVRLDHQYVNRLADCDGYIKLYRNASLRFFGPLISAEQSVDRDSQTLALTAADQGWILGKRLAGKSALGQQFTSATDLAQISKTLIDTTNTMSETGISTTTVAMSAGSARTYTAGPYRPILEIVAELGQALDGFDWRIVPIENWVNGAVVGTKMCYIEAVPLIGTNKPTAIFEYGLNTRSNILTFNKTRTRDSQANRVFQSTQDFADVVSSDNAAAQTAWGVLEDILSLPDITDSTMRTQIVTEHTNVRGNPRDLVRITPHIDPGVTGRLPLPFVDYDIGDSVTARIVNAGQVRFAGLLRVYGINVSAEDETGFERVDLIAEDES